MCTASSILIRFDMDQLGLPFWAPIIWCHFQSQLQRVARCGKLLGFWIHLAPNMVCMSDVKSESRGMRSRSIKHPRLQPGHTQHLANSCYRGHDHRGTQLAHAAMGCPAASRHEVPQDLRIDHQRAAKCCSLPDPRSPRT